MTDRSSVVSEEQRRQIINERMMYLLRQNGGEMRFEDLADEMIRRGWAVEDIKNTDQLALDDIIRIKNPMKRMQ